MKKIIVLAVAAMLALPAMAFAVTGECSNCHTMHNSFQGTPMAQLADGSPSTAPFPILLRSNCLGCHANGQGDAIHPDFASPQVYHTNATDLAGGNFAYIDGLKTGGDVIADDDRKGHNVVDLMTADQTFTYPPGFGMGSLGLHGTPTDKLPVGSFTCAGNDGCHGTRNTMVDDGTGNATTVKLQGLAAMAGAHHSNVTGQVNGAATTAGGSYRFLTGVWGLEDVDWQFTTGPADHNEYYGTNAGSPFTGDCADCHVGGVGAGLITVKNIKAPANSMSGFCSTCHGTFHEDTVSGNFVRHPTDYTLPTTGEYAAYTAWNADAPVALTTVPATADGTIVPGSDLVQCLSCHVAHGSAHESMLRWDYSGMLAGQGANDTGCFICHTTKDDTP